MSNGDAGGRSANDAEPFSPVSAVHVSGSPRGDERCGCISVHGIAVMDTSAAGIGSPSAPITSTANSAASGSATSSTPSSPKLSTCASTRRRARPSVFATKNS